VQALAGVLGVVHLCPQVLQRSFARIKGQGMVGGFQG